MDKYSLNDMEIAFNKKEFDELAGEFRYVIADMICRAGSGHLGGALSLVEIIISLYYRIMKVDPQKPKWADRDRLVMSKGHAGPVLYTALAYKGFFPRQWLGTLNANGTNLPSHADQILTPGIDMTTGSLGQGLSCACGIALSNKMDKKQNNVFCIIGDGESNEGQIWEAALFAGHKKLDKLVAICDYNKLQIDGYTGDILNLEPLMSKWESFNWTVFEMDGHDWDDIFNTINKAIETKGRPKMIIAHTVKAKGCKIFENKPESHNIKVPDRDSHLKFMHSLEKTNYRLPY